MNPEDLIREIRESFTGSVRVYTEGSCYQFYRILKCVFPQAIAWYDMNHVITEIDGEFYDITGKVKRKSHLRMDEHYRINNVITRIKAEVGCFTHKENAPEN